MVRVGLIGLGAWGRKIAATVAATDDVRLVCVASSNPNAGTLIPSGAAVIRSWRELVTDAPVDGVIVATPPALHATMASTALESGRAVWIEKPLTLEVREAEELVRLASRRGGPALVDHIHLFHPGYVELKRRLERLGPISEIRSAGGNWGPFRPDTSPLWDYGAHDVAMCIDLCGSVVDVAKASIVRTAPSPAGRAEVVSVEMELAGGPRAFLEVGNAMESKRRWLEVRCARGVATLDDLADPELVIDDGRGARPIPVDGTPPLTRVVESFRDMIGARSSDLRQLELGAAVVRTLTRIEAALKGDS